MSKAKHNPIAAALRSGRITRCAAHRNRKGKGSYTRKPKHRRAYA